MKPFIGMALSALVLAGCLDEETTTDVTTETTETGVSSNTVGLPFNTPSTTNTSTSGESNSELRAKLINGESADQFETIWACIEENETDFSDAGFFSFFADSTGYLISPDGDTAAQLQWDVSGSDLNFTINGISDQYAYASIQFTTEYQFVANATENGAIVGQDVCMLYTTEGEPVDDTSSSTNGSTTIPAGGFSENNTNESDNNDSIQFANNMTYDTIEDAWFCSAESDFMIMFLLSTGQGAAAFLSNEDDYLVIDNWSASDSTLSLTLEDNSKIELNNLNVFNNDTFSADSLNYGSANYGSTTCVRITDFE